MDADRRKQILSRPKPDPTWPGEPLLGGWYGEEEIEVVEKTIRESMDWRVGFGFICDEILEFERAFAEYNDTAECVTINGAGTGLDMALMCLDLQPEDEVIVPSVNFRAAPMAVLGQGARLVMGEIEPEGFQLDPNHVEKLMTPNTRAILPTHMNGLAAPMDDYEAIAEKCPHPKQGPAKVIGDAARCGAGGYKGQRIGKPGWMTIFSFHTQKLMTTLGEGGALTTDDVEAAKRLRELRQFGGASGWGSNYKLTKVQAAVGMIQLRKLDEMTGLRRQRALERTAMLQGIPEITLPHDPQDRWHTYYLYTCLVPKEWAGEKRDRLNAMMVEDFGIGCVVANPPTHQTIPFIRENAVNLDLPVSDELASRLTCVSLHPLMTEEDNEYICAALWECVERIRAGE